MPLKTDRAQKTCAHCGVAFAPKRADAKYCHERCKDAANNRRKRAKRNAIVKRDGQRCSFKSCRWTSPKRRLYVDLVKGARITLCGYHHAEIFRPKGSADCKPVTGGFYYGYLHISIYSLLEREFTSNGEDCPLQTDGGINQLLDFLSGEVDEAGDPIPHPLIEERRERSVYLNPKTWNPEAVSV